MMLLKPFKVVEAAEERLKVHLPPNRFKIAPYKHSISQLTENE